MDKRVDYPFPTSVAARALDEAMKNANSPIQKKAVTASNLVTRFYAWRKGSQLRQQEETPSTPIKSKTKEIALRDKPRNNPPGVICANDNSRLQWEQDYVTFLEMKQQEIEDKRQQITAVLEDAAKRKMEVETIAEKIRSLEKHLRDADSDEGKIETINEEKELKKRRTSAISQILNVTDELESAAKNADNIKLMELREEIRVKSVRLLELESLVQKMEMEQRIYKELIKDKEDALRGKDDATRNKEDEIKYLNKQFDAERETFAILLQEKDKELQKYQESENQRIELALEKHNKELKSYLKELQSKYLEEFETRRKLYNELQGLKGNIRVFCRVRPLNKSEGNGIVEFPMENILQVHDKKFEFDKVFKPEVSQEEVFNEVKPLVCSVLDGFNVCIFAYGQTGSGKSYTMEGPPENRGVNFRALNELFNITLSRKATHKYKISVSMLEIYNEQIRDLLSESNTKKLEVKQGQHGVYVPDLTNIEVNSTADIWDIMQAGRTNRSVSATDCNEHSSRSHSILNISISGENTISGSTMHARLYLVDLAGSERVAISGVTGERLKEAQHINKSLSTLGTVVASLVQKNPHIPYRDSKLTYLLKDCLGGDSKTLMICQVSPAEQSESESISSLKFASRVGTVENGPAKQNIHENTLLKFKEETRKLKEEIKQRDDKIEELKSTSKSAQKSSEEILSKLNEKDKEIRQLKTQLDEMHLKFASQQQQIQQLQAQQLQTQQLHAQQLQQKAQQLQAVKPEPVLLNNFTLIPPPVAALSQASPEDLIQFSPVLLDLDDQRDKENFSQSEMNSSVIQLVAPSTRKVHFAESPADKPSLKRKDIQIASVTPARRVKAKTDKPLIPEVPLNLPKPAMIPLPVPLPAISPFSEKQTTNGRVLRSSTLGHSSSNGVPSRKPVRVPIKQTPKTPPPRRVLINQNE